MNEAFRTNYKQVNDNFNSIKMVEPFIWNILLHLDGFKYLNLITIKFTKYETIKFYYEVISSNIKVNFQLEVIDEYIERLNYIISNKKYLDFEIFISKLKGLLNENPE